MSVQEVIREIYMMPVTVTRQESNKENTSMCESLFYELVLS